jgi:hypothetical protein
MGPGDNCGNLVQAGKTSSGIVDVTMGSFVFSLRNPAREQQSEISPSTRPVGRVVQARLSLAVATSGCKDSARV